MSTDEVKKDTDQINKLVIEFKYFRDDLNEVKRGQKETNNKLEIMRDGYVSRDEFREFKAIVATLASKEELINTENRITTRFSLSEKIVFGFIAILLSGFALLVVNTYLKAPIK